MFVMLTSFLFPVSLYLATIEDANINLLLSYSPFPIATGPVIPDGYKYLSPSWRKILSFLFSLSFLPTISFVSESILKCLPILRSSTSAGFKSFVFFIKSLTLVEYPGSVKRHPPAGEGYFLMPSSFASCIWGFLDLP